MGLTPLALATLATTVAGTGASIAFQAKAQQRQDRAAKLASAQADVENQKQIRQAIAAARADRANLIAAGAAQTGGFDASGIAGGAAAAETQLASNVGFARQTAGVNRRLNALSQGAANLSSRAAVFGQIAQLPGALGFDTESILRERKARNP